MNAPVTRVALVTGGVRRVGAGIAARLAKDGFAVVIHSSARSEREAQRSLQHMSDQGLRASYVVADLANAGQTEGLIAKATIPFGAIDLLINNASAFESDDIATLEAGLFDRMQAINLRAPLMLAKSFAAQADIDRDPSIINLLDQRVLKPNPLYLSYLLSKSGLATATTVLAQALAPSIRVNAVAPGPVLPNEHEGGARFEAEVKKVPLERPVSIEAIVDAVAYLAHARNVTGQTIAVDSGQRIAWRTPDVAASMGEA